MEPSKKIYLCFVFLVLCLNLRFVFFPEWFESEQNTTVGGEQARSGASGVRNTSGAGNQVNAKRSNAGDGNNRDQADCLQGGFRESDPVIIRSGCINDASRTTAYLATATFKIHVAHSAHENMSDLVDALKQTGRILNQCGVWIDDVDVNTMLDGGLYHFVDRPDYFRMVNQYRKTDFPELFVVHAKDARWQGRNAGLAFTSSWVGSNTDQHFRHFFKVEPTHANRMKLSDSMLIMTDYLEDWTNRRLRNMQNGKVIAHELYHVYGDCMCHTRQKGNFMSVVGGFTENPTVTQEQCATLLSGVKRFNRNDRNSNRVFANN